MIVSWYLSQNEREAEFFLPHKTFDKKVQGTIGDFILQ